MDSLRPAGVPFEREAVIDAQNVEKAVGNPLPDRTRGQDPLHMAFFGSDELPCVGSRIDGELVVLQLFRVVVPTVSLVVRVPEILRLCCFPEVTQRVGARCHVEQE